MLFNLKNVGTIDSASIEIKGLTVLTGLNDIGKSYVTKSIFSIIKTIRKARQQASIDRYEAIRNSLSVISTTYRQSSRMPHGSGLVFIKIQELAEKMRFGGQIDLFDFDYDYLTALDTLKEMIFQDLSAHMPNPQFQSTFSRISKSIEEIKSVYSTDSDDEKKYIRFFSNTIVKGLFQDQFNSITDGNKNEHSEISVSEGTTELVNVSIINNKARSFKITDDIFFTDVTLIESPIILQLNDFITTSLAYLRGSASFPQLQYHFLDLSEKIRTSFGNADPFASEISSELQKIIGGTVYYDNTEKTIVYQRDKGFRIKSANIASGIKSFGLLQLLLSSGAINSRSLLIIDEPEVHLHPKWEILYAKLIIDMCKAGMYIVISSHSPFLLKALFELSKKNDLQEITKFYFGERDENYRTTFTDVSNDINPIFKLLTEPLQDLYSL